MDKVSVFVTYAWIEDSPDKDVMNLVAELRKEGFTATCDVMLTQQETAIHFTQMMAKSLFENDKVIVVLSEKYKARADLFIGGVGEEYQYLIDDIKKNKQKYVFVTFEDERESVLPDFIKGREVITLNKLNPVDDDLKHKLLNTERFSFPDVATSISRPETIVIGEDKEDNSDINMFDSSTPFFDYRIKGAFPGVRGLRIFDDAETSVKRLMLLMKNPLGSKKLMTPIWYFRGNSCLSINKFKSVSPTKCIMNNDELEIDYIAAYISTSYYRDFVYVQTKPEEPIGLYDTNAEYVKKMQEMFGYYHEEYGMFNETPITRTELDDGAAEIDGEVVDVTGKVELRVRYITPYNFIICAQFHPFNSSLGDEFTENGLNAILKGDMTLEEFARQSEKLPRHRREE
ncbi:hypothetical protein M2145_002958 [Lachnospiraceae bacterium PF1-21]